MAYQLHNPRFIFKSFNMRLILIAFIMVASIGNLSAQNQQPSGITVSGEGIVKVTPDRVKIKVRVENQGQTANEVKSETDKSVSKILDFLKKEKISKNDFQTDYINLNKTYDYNKKETYYKAEQSINITLINIDQYSKIMTGLMNSGVNRIDGVTFENSKIAEYEKQARVKAVENAKEKAEDYAQSLNLKVGPAQMVSESGSSSPQPVMLRTMSADAMGTSNQPDSPIAIGQIEIRQKVEIRFAINLK